MKTSFACIVSAAIVLAGSYLMTAPAAIASEIKVQSQTDVTAYDMSARKRIAKRHRGTSLHVSRLSRRATEPPNPYRPYYRPAPTFFPFAMDRGYF